MDWTEKDHQEVEKGGYKAEAVRKFLFSAEMLSLQIRFLKTVH
jgi:hypothetical protein